MNINVTKVVLSGQKRTRIKSVDVVSNRERKRSLVQNNDFIKETFPVNKTKSSLKSDVLSDSRPYYNTISVNDMRIVVDTRLKLMVEQHAIEKLATSVILMLSFGNAEDSDVFAFLFHAHSLVETKLDYLDLCGIVLSKKTEIGHKYNPYILTREDIDAVRYYAYDTQGVDFNIMDGDVCDV
jgi:hypothetical protein